mmetsp:Transcript_27232/g.63455  ORF Transcript_27232/g.63455 Transcript_27232/m.63455 type:complete len:225 (+) Transcript_27232:668-1342(+)
MPSDTVRSIARRLCLSITTSSPAASCFIITVPPAARKAIPSPCSLFRNIPCPAQQHAPTPRTRSNCTFQPSPLADKKAPLFIAMPLNCRKSTGTIFAGNDGVNATLSTLLPARLWNFIRKKDSPAQQQRVRPWPKPPTSASILTPEVMNSIECGSAVITSPGLTVSSNTWLNSLPVIWKSLSGGGAVGVQISKPECIACCCGAATASGTAATSGAFSALMVPQL